MKKIGLTGGIGSGKTLVAEMFNVLGVPVFNSDQVARDLQNDDIILRNAITAALGDVYTSEGKLDRQKTAAIVFSDPEKLKALNEIVHPAVGNAFIKFCEKNAKAPYVVKEAAIIFEHNLEKNLDGVILITAPENVRVQRVIERDGISEAEVISRIKAQWPDEKKLPLSKWIIRNDGKFPVLPQVLRIHEELTTG